MCINVKIKKILYCIALFFFLLYTVDDDDVKTQTHLKIN